MKHTLYLLAIILGFFLITISSCKDKIDDTQPVEKIYEGNLKYIDLQGLQEFYENGYTIINGSLEIDYFDNIKDMSLLSNLKRVHGDFHIIVNPELESLEGLNQLDTVSGSFKVVYCPKITNMKGVENLKYVGVDFRAMNNESMINLEGMDNLNYVGLKFKISSNDNMTSLNGIGSLKTVGALEIGESDSFGNDNLQSIEALSGLQEVIHRFEISRNPKLKSLNGLENLIKSGLVIITKNDLLTDFCSLENVIQSGGLSGSFTVESNSYNPTLDDIINGNCSQ